MTIFYSLTQIKHYHNSRWLCRKGEGGGWRLCKSMKMKLKNNRETCHKQKSLESQNLASSKINILSNDYVITCVYTGSYFYFDSDCVSRADFYSYYGFDSYCDDLFPVLSTVQPLDHPPCQYVRVLAEVMVFDQIPPNSFLYL